MANDINKEDPHYKGEYGSIYEVNRKFPTGGVAGDFVVIDGWAHYWNADRGTWCVNAERDSYWDELITNIIEKFKLVRGATYMGVASLDTVPTKVIGAKMYYFATVAGTYKNFGDLVVPQGINVLYSENGSSWVNTTLLEVAQELGVSTNKVVNQKTLNDAFAKKFDKESVVQEPGEAEDKVMSQKAVSDKLSDLALRKYKNCRISLIGDSISTFKGYIPSNYLTYYPQGKIDSVNKTYWHIVCKALDASIQNLSYSGSTVTTLNYKDFNFYKRALLVDKNASLIIVALGVNDVGMEGNLGDYDYNKDISEYDESIFTEAYIKGLRTLISNHPTADICLVRISRANEMIGRAQAIKTIAEHYGVMYFDASGCYDGALHPDTDDNDDGSEMKKIANGLLSVLSSQSDKGYLNILTNVQNSSLTFDCSIDDSVAFNNLKEAIDTIPVTMQKPRLVIKANIKGQKLIYQLQKNSWSSNADDWALVKDSSSIASNFCTINSLSQYKPIFEINTEAKTIKCNTHFMIVDSTGIREENYTAASFETTFVTDYDVTNRLGILFLSYSDKKIYWYDFLKELPKNVYNTLDGFIIGTIIYNSKDVISFGFNFNWVKVNGVDYYGNSQVTPDLLNWLNRLISLKNKDYCYEIELFQYYRLIEQFENNTWVEGTTINSFNGILPDGTKEILVKTNENCVVWLTKDLNYLVAQPNFASGNYKVSITKDTFVQVPEDAQYITISSAKTNKSIHVYTDKEFNCNRHLTGGAFSYNFIHKKIYFVKYKTYENYNGNGLFTKNTNSEIVDENIRNIRDTSPNISDTGYRFSFEATDDAISLNITGKNAMNEVEIIEWDDRKTPYFIVDGDISGDVDDLIALRVMAQAEKEGKLIIAGINCSYNDTNSVQGIDGFMCHEGLYDVPIGLEKTLEAKNNSIYLPICAKYPHSYKSNDEVDDSLEFYRKILTWLPYNHKNILLTLGGMPSLERVLKDSECYNLLSEKIYKIYVMGSQLPTSYGETNFNLYGIDNVNYVLANTPVPIYIVPFAIGGHVLGGASMGNAGMSFDLLQRSLAAYKYESPTKPVTRECPDPLTAICAIADDEQSLGLYKRRMSNLTINSDKSIHPTYANNIGELYHLQINSNEYLTEDLYNQQKQYMLDSILIKKDGIYKSNVVRMNRN